MTTAGIAPRRIFCRNFMKTALFISPHLDDAVFSCGGTLAKMAGEGWRTILCTIFTKSVLNPKEFALACQLDKNLSADVDYMKLRRAEDFRAARILKAAEVLHLNFPEAPHRGYESAPELFAGVKAGDEIWKPVAEHLELLNEIHQPEIVFAPQGLGNHCDHKQTIEATLRSFAAEKVRWYRDTPYSIRQPDALYSKDLPEPLEATACDIGQHLNSKIEACACYESQINFQFGGREELAAKLIRFHESEGQRLKVGFAAENFLTFQTASKSVQK